MKKNIIKPIALFATREELKQFELIKRHHNRASNADMLRVLIKQEAEKILAQNNHKRLTTAN